jgi:FkbM family methyltransferase
MKHYLATCRKILSTQYRFNRMSLLVAYASLVVRSFLTYRFNRGRGKLIKANVAGYKITAFSYSQLINLVEEIFIYEVYRPADSTAVHTIIDCGSNIGMSILYFKKLYPESKLIGFEPDHETFKLLTTNINDNHLGNVELHQVALSNRESDVGLYSKRSRSGSLNMSLFKSAEMTEENKVVASRLLNYIKSEVDLLKIDIEGAEVMIIQDLIDANKLQLIRQLIIEYHPDITGKPVESFISLLESRNFYGSCEKDSIHPGATEVMIRATQH